jgi:ABC-type glycerol-3-phosphate transport system substrate-binding protein
MKKHFLLVSAALIMTVTSCSNQKEGSAPKVRTEIYTDAPDTSKATAEESNENVILTYAVVGQIEPDEYELIKKFNDADNGYVIETRDYSEIAGADENGNIEYDPEKSNNLDIILLQDIASGKIDIVRDYYLGGATLDRLMARGSFIDLYDLMDTDHEVNSFTLNSHILELHEINGKLYTLPTYFSVKTLIGKTRYVGEKEGWTLDEFISHWEQMPEGSTIQGSTEKDIVYQAILNGMIGSFIDYKNAKVYFDSPEFKKALEFCNTFDNISLVYSEPDMEALSFVDEKHFYGFSNTHLTLWNKEGEPYTFVGYPSSDGCGGFIETLGNRFAISASASETERLGAWEFIRTHCLEEYQTEHYAKKDKVMIDGEIKDVYQESVGFPMNLKAYDHISKDSMTGKYMEDTITMSGKEVEVGQLTQEELDRLTSYINGIQNLSVAVDHNLNEIIRDEVYSYFNDELSVQECIDLIQNRAAIMVAEKQ